MSIKNSQGTWVQLTPEELEAALATAVGTRNITTDNGWTTAVAAVFNATNAPGLTPLARQFMIEFFSRFVGVGRTP